ncbi:hypothetical protein [Nocardioides sp.]|uniref:hypothetical protein n=1 Tax=Nocardioides sp. TaxID=35761 RepID=UPI00286B0EF5|nr:hypothetical protein [Nocardioides sp.]
MSVHVQHDGEVTIVVLDRPEVRNAVTTEHARALYEAFIAFEADTSASSGDQQARTRDLEARGASTSSN